MTVQRCPGPSTPVVGNVKIATSAPAPGRYSGGSDRTSALIGTPLLVLGVALAAANLRPAVTSLAPLLDRVRESLGASHAWASALTAVPAVCFGAAGLLAPMLGRRLGMARTIGAALVLMTAGLVVRVLGGPLVVLGGTLVACAGIAIGNVALPVVIKQSFPHRIGLITGVYTAALAAGGGLGAAAGPGLADLLGGWRAALGAWALLSAAALLVWSAAARHLPTPTETRTPPSPSRSLLRSPLAWTVTAFFGLQALVAYTVMGWLPEVFLDAGLDRSAAGVMLAVTSLLGVPLSLLLPPLAARWRHQSGLIVALTALGGVGVLGLLLAPAAVPLLWTVLIGFGMGVFPLAITLIALRTADPADTAALSAMAQGVGYLIGALGPFAFGLLRGLTGGWTASLLFVLVAILAQAAFGWMAGRDRQVRA